MSTPQNPQPSPQDAVKKIMDELKRRMQEDQAPSEKGKD